MDYSSFLRNLGSLIHKVLRQYEDARAFSNLQHSPADRYYNGKDLESTTKISIFLVVRFTDHTYLSLHRGDDSE